MTKALQALVASSVDYAGLFPPASLALAPALTNHASYARSKDAWMLGVFVLPIAKFDEAAADLTQFDVEHRINISALGLKTDRPAEFVSALGSTAEAIRNLQSQRGAIASVTQLEMPLPTQPGATISEAYQTLGDLQMPVFWESAADEAERMIDALAQHRRDTASTTFGFKLRTGGVVASAFPSSIQIARALVAATQHRVPIKFTAGLHHPIRQYHSSVQTTMHGFVNVLGGGVLAAEHGWDAVQTMAILDEEDASAFTFTDDAFLWREWQITTDRIRTHRQLVTSFGSCSFDEPREDLRALNLL